MPPGRPAARMRLLLASAALLLLVGGALAWNRALTVAPKPVRDPAIDPPAKVATKTEPPAQPQAQPAVTVPRGVDTPPPAAEPTPKPEPTAGPTAGTPKPRVRPERPSRAGAHTVKPPAQPQADPDPLAAVRPAEPTADELTKQAAGELVQGHLARAVELYRRASQRDPRNAAAWRGLGVTSERLGLRDAARRAYQRALKLTPPGPQADSMRARLEQLGAQP
jgi:eukaryotic-like serine/threonine-protein kinase